MTKKSTELTEDVVITSVNLAAFALGVGQLRLAIQTGSIFSGLLAAGDIGSTIADQYSNSYYLEQFLIEEYGETKAQEMIAEFNFYNLAAQLFLIPTSIYDIWRAKRKIPINGNAIEQINDNAISFVRTNLPKNSDEFIDVVIHGEGSNFVVQIEGVSEVIPAKELAIYIHNNFPNDKPIRLLSCSDLKAAEALSVASGREVIATDYFIYLTSAGEIGTEGAQWYRVTPDGRLEIQIDWDIGRPSDNIEFIRLGRMEELYGEIMYADNPMVYIGTRSLNGENPKLPYIGKTENPIWVRYPRVSKAPYPFTDWISAPTDKLEDIESALIKHNGGRRQDGGRIDNRNAGKGDPSIGEQWLDTELPGWRNRFKF